MEMVIRSIVSKGEEDALQNKSSVIPASKLVDCRQMCTANGAISVTFTLSWLINIVKR